MRVSGEDYSKRLRTFSNDTMQLIMQLQNRATFKEANRIAAETDYSEEEVVRRLKALEEKQSPTTSTTTEAKK